MKDHIEVLNGVLEILGDIPRHLCPYVAASLIEIERERLGNHVNKNYVLDILKVTEREVAKAHREVFGSPYQPVNRNRLSSLSIEEVRGYMPAATTGIRYENLYLLYRMGWIDLRWLEGKPFVSQESWEMYKQGIRKYILLRRVPGILGASSKYIQSFIGSGILPVEKRVDKYFVDRDDIETFRKEMDNWISISQAAIRLGISREHLRHNVKRAGLKIVPYSSSYLVRWNEIEGIFSQLPKRTTFVSPVRLKRVLGVDGDQDLEELGAEYKTIYGRIPVITMKSVRHLVYSQNV